MSNTFQALTEIIRRELDDDTLALTRATTAKDVDGWDSMMHVNLIVAIESELGFTFNSSEIGGFKNMGDMADAVDRHLAAKRK